MQVAATGDMIIVGDSKLPDGPVLTYTRDEWTTFVDAVRQGEFDTLG